MKTSTKTFTLKVKLALKVEEGEEDIVASLIETGVEVDLAPSIEHDEIIERIETLNQNDERKREEKRERRNSPRRKEGARVRLKRKKQEKVSGFEKAMAKTPVKNHAVHVIERSKNTNIFTDG